MYYIVYIIIWINFVKNDFEMYLNTVFKTLKSQNWIIQTHNFDSFQIVLYLSMALWPNYLSRNIFEIIV